MDKQAVKMKTLGAIFLISLLSFGCGGAGTTPAGDGSPTLGITSVQAGAGKPTPKPNFALNLMNKGLGFFLDQPVLAAVCPTGGQTFPIDTGNLDSGSGSRVWVSQAYLIMDEIEFNFGFPNLPRASDPQTGPFAFDLTNSDALVPERVTLDPIKFPPANYDLAKFKIARLDNTIDPVDQRPINLGNHLNDFMRKLLLDTGSTATSRRPSVWIEGIMRVGATGPCKTFTFFTDKLRQEETIFSSTPLHQTVDPSTLDVVFFLDILQAFKDMDNDPSFFQELELEIVNDLGVPDLLDGRLEDNSPLGFGTLRAQELATGILGQFQVWVQNPGTFNGTLSASAEQAS